MHSSVTMFDSRTRVFRVVILVCVAAVVFRLFVLQVLARNFYTALASNQQSFYQDLFPDRGIISIRDPKSPETKYPVAINKTLTTVVINPKLVTDPRAVSPQLATVLGLKPEDVFAKVSRPNDSYEILKKQVDDTTVQNLKSLNIKALQYTSEAIRWYPEKNIFSQLTGFVGVDDSGSRAGKYGLEGWWNTQLAGEQGFLEADRDPIGRLIGTAGRTIRPAQDGVNLTLTIDRTVQYVACAKLRAAVTASRAATGTVVILNPQTGAIIAMCSVPDFDPNEYASTKDFKVFNNQAIFTPYEPGSVFKAITMAAGVDAGKVTPQSTYVDAGAVSIGGFTIRNSDLKTNGTQTMSQVLEKSLNTGVMYVAGLLGPEKFQSYVDGFGFGKSSGIEMNTEASGNTTSLSNKGEIWSATASFGQGITVTPLQLATAYAAIANGGKLLRPYIVQEVDRPDGTKTVTQPRVIRQVISERASVLVTSMLVGVVERGHGKRAGVPGYFVAGKTGTAQIPRKDGKGYEKEVAIGSFAGFAPADNPAFVMVTKLERPEGVQWAESTAAPVFGEIAKFLLQYYEIPPERK